MTLSDFYKNKVVIITGSSMGIGKELAKQVLSFGGKTVLTGRNLNRLKEVEKELEHFKSSILLHQVDVADFKSNEELISKTISRFGKLDILINNAGLSGIGEVSKMNVEISKKIIDTNIYGSLFPTIAALPELQKTSGSVFFISSIAGFQGIPEYSCYCLSKMALKALAQSLWIEQKKNNVFVGIAYLGFTENETKKKTFSADGNLMEVPKRPKLLTNTRTETAAKILKQIKNRKHKEIHSLAGKILYRMNLFFPDLLNNVNFHFKKLRSHKH